jgi:hypothetical protein
LIFGVSVAIINFQRLLFGGKGGGKEGKREGCKAGRRGKEEGGKADRREGSTNSKGRAKKKGAERRKGRREEGGERRERHTVRRGPKISKLVPPMSFSINHTNSKGRTKSSSLSDSEAEDPDFPGITELFGFFGFPRAIFVLLPFTGGLSFSVAFLK